MIEKYEEIIEKIKHERMYLYLKLQSKCFDQVNFVSLVKFENGAQPPKSEHIYSYKRGYIKFIQNRDYTSDSHPTFIPISRRNKLCNEYDIMIDKYGEAGTVRYGLNGAYNVALEKVIPNDQLYREFIRCFLSQKSIQSILYSSSQASTRPSLNESTFTALQIKIPTTELLSEFNNKAINLLTAEFKYLHKIKKLKETKTLLLNKYFD